MAERPQGQPRVIANPTITHKCPQIQPALDRLFQPWMGSIRAKIESSGGIQRGPDCNSLRFELVFHACHDGDLFCLALHQIFCLWDLPGPNQIMNLPGFPDEDTLLCAFKVLDQLILENQGLAPDHKKWFAFFPIPLHEFMNPSEPYRGIIKQVGAFLGRLAADWESLSRVSGDGTALQPLPLMGEMERRLGLRSPMLQSVAFTAMYRNWRRNDDRYGNNMEAVFKLYRPFHPVLDDYHNTAIPPMKRKRTLVWNPSRPEPEHDAMPYADGIGTQPQGQSRPEVSSLDKSNPVREIFFTFRNKDHKYDLDNPIPARCMRGEPVPTIFCIVSKHSGIPLETIHCMTFRSVFAKKVVENIEDVLYKNTDQQGCNEIKDMIKRRWECVQDEYPEQEKFEIYIKVHKKPNVVSEDTGGGIRGEEDDQGNDDEMLDVEEGAPPQTAAERRKAKRFRFTVQQTNFLKEEFAKEESLSLERYQTLSKNIPSGGPRPNYA